MKIIDFERKGNVVRFYLGDDDCNDYCGDDWNDYPYDCNAGNVYEEFVKGHRDLCFPFDDMVLEPKDGVLDCGVSKEDMIKRITPCIIVVPHDLIEDGWALEDFNKWKAADGVKKFYFGDKMEEK